MYRRMTRSLAATQISRAAHIHPRPLSCLILSGARLYNGSLRGVPILSRISGAAKARASVNAIKVPEICKP